METKNKLTLRGRMISHLAMETAHLSIYEFEIRDGERVVTTFYKESKTAKRKGTYGSFGKTEIFFYFADTQKGNEFKTTDELLQSIGLNKDQFEKADEAKKDL